MSLRSDLSKARGLGSAKEGGHHWLAQRITAVAMIPLVIWLVTSIFMFEIPSNIKELSTEELHALSQAWLATPLNSIMSILFLITMFYHGALGIQVVLEDYVSHPFAKVATIMLAKILCFAATVIGIFAVISVYVKG